MVKGLRASWRRPRDTEPARRYNAAFDPNFDILFDYRSADLVMPSGSQRKIVGGLELPTRGGALTTGT